jgi:hypothetical protein
MRIWLGAVPLRVNTPLLADGAKALAPRAVYRRGDLTPAEETFRMALKALAVAGLPMLRRYVAAHFPGMPLPNPPKHGDRLEYTANYLLSLIVAGAELQEWRAEFTEEPDGAILITDLIPITPTAALALGPGGAAPRADAPAGPDDERGDPRQSGGPLVPAGDDGDGEDDLRPGPHAGATPALPRSHPLRAR